MATLEYDIIFVMLLVFRGIFILVLYFNTFLIGSAQNTVYKFPNNRESVVIPFEFEYNFIIVKVRANDKYFMRFIVDTGAEYSVIDSTAASLLDISLGRKVNVVGADHSSMLVAHVGSGINLRLSDFQLNNFRMLIFPDYLPQFEILKHLHISGIIGADVLSRYLVKLDFKRQEMTLISSPKHRIPSGFSDVPFMIVKNRPYLQLPVSVTGKEPVNKVFLFDTGAGLPLLLTSHREGEAELPEKVISGKLGLGVGGFIEGTIGKTDRLIIGPYTMYNVLTSFQQLDSVKFSLPGFNKDGIVGNDVIRLFTWYIDYSHEHCYLKPNRDFREIPEYDKSGISILLTGKGLDRYLVIGVAPGSPAAAQDIRTGDRIVGVNRLCGAFLNYNKIVRILSRKEGEVVRLKLKRNGETLTKTIRLENIL